MSQAKDIFEAVSHRLPNIDALYPVLNAAIRTINKRLYFHRSGMVIGELSVSVTADSDGTLPTDFWGLHGFPYINGKTYKLDPLPDLKTKLSYTGSSTPVYYRIVGQTLRLIPTTDSNITINGDYWKRPTKITAPSDTIPYFELFDDAIQEYVIHLYMLGSKGDQQQVGTLKNFVWDSVDSVVPYIDMDAPDEVTQSVDWAGME